MEELNTKLGQEAVEAAAEIARLGGVIDDYAENAPAADLDKILEPADQLLAAQMEDKDVRTNPYLSGIANGIRLALAAVRNEDVPEEDLIKPVVQAAVKGAVVLTGRQLLIKEASKFITLAGAAPALRSGLSAEDVARADEIMVALKVPEGTYDIPAG